MPSQTERYAFNPDWVVHPGGLLREAVKERGMSQAEFCRRSGWTPKHVNRVIRGRASITAEFAWAIELELGVSALVWLNLQAIYDLGVVQGKVVL